MKEPLLDGLQEILTGPVENLVVVAVPGHDELEVFVG